MRILASLLPLLWVSLGVAAEPARLHLFIWSEYIDPAVITAFEKRHSCKVTVDLYEDAESMLAKVQGGGVSLYDVVVPPDHIVPAMVKLKLLAPLRHERIPNLKNLDKQFLNPPYDGGNQFTVPYQWGTLGIFARQPAGRNPLPRTWGLLFDAKLQPGPFLLIDSPRDMLGAALKYKHHSLNSTNSADLKEARDLVLAAKKRSLGFEGSVGGKNRVLAKLAAAAIVYNGEGLRGVAEDKETVYFIPDEGSQIWVDNLAVLAQAPHRDLAEKFIDFVLDARIGAQISSFTQYSSPNRAALEFLRPEDLKNPTMYPPPEARAKLEVLTDLGSRTRVYDEVWTQIKAK
jgi:spermidine/putrescine transport system substrate-binding protein